MALHTPSDQPRPHPTFQSTAHLLRDNYSALRATLGSATQQAIMTTYSTIATGCRTLGSNLCAIRPVRNGATAPPAEPADEMNAMAEFWSERGSSLAKTDVALG